MYNWRKILDMVKWPNLSKINLSTNISKYRLLRNRNSRSQIFTCSTIGLSCRLKARYICQNLDGNKIGMGVKLLIKINFRQLKKFTLSRHKSMLDNCDLGEEGAKHLVKGYYPGLTFLSLCNCK